MGSTRKLAFGIVLIAAAFVLWFVLHSMSGRTQTTASTTPVPNAVPASTVPEQRGRIVQAIQDIPAGSIIAPGMYTLVQPQKGQSMVGLITDEKKVVGYITRRALNRGAFPGPDDFVGHISEVGIAGALRPGMRAMMIPIGNKPTLHDLVRIGNYIDVYAAFDSQESRAVVQNVRVLAVDDTANDYPPLNAAMRGGYKADPKGNVQPGAAPVEPGATPAPTPAATAPPPATAAITIEVSPVQAAQLLLTQASGANFDFLLRPSNPGNSESMMPGSATGAAPAEQEASVSAIKSDIAPYAERVKYLAAHPPKSTGVGESRHFNGPSFGNPNTVAKITPVTQFPTPVPPPATYEIPIYADGKVVRTETVRQPQ